MFEQLCTVKHVQMLSNLVHMLQWCNNASRQNGTSWRECYLDQCSPKPSVQNQIWTSLHWQLSHFDLNFCGHVHNLKWWHYTKWCNKENSFAWLNLEKSISVDFYGLQKLHWQLFPNELKFGGTLYFYMPFHPVKSHVKCNSFSSSNHHQTPSDRI